MSKEKELVPDALWQQVVELLPAHPDHPDGGNDFAGDRLCLRGIIFVLNTGIGWQDLPTECFGVSGSTCWRRMRDWTAAGVWSRLHELILQHLDKAHGFDGSTAVIDSASVRAVKGGATPAPTRPIAALAHDGMRCSTTVDGAIDGDMFVAFCEQVLTPTLREGDVVVMDNLSSHKVAGG